MLVLFDIDGTLLQSQHAGMHAMVDAFQYRKNIFI